MATTSITPEVKQANDVVSQKILINGQALSGEIKVNAISVTAMHNKIATAVIVLHDGNAASRDFEQSNADTFKPGNTIEINLGFHTSTEPVFKGVITKQALYAKQKESSFLFIEAKNKAVKLTVGRKNKYFFDKKDSDIASQVCSSAGIGLQMEATSVTHREMVQYYATDWDFLLQRAEANGMLVYTGADQLEIKKPGISAAPVLTATYGDNIFEIETEMDARRHFKSVKTYSWNAAEQKIEQSDEGDFSFDSNGNISENDLAAVMGLPELSIHHSGDIKDVELNQWANAFSMRDKLSKNYGKIKVIGNAAVKPGSVVAIAGISDRFNGNVFVTGVQHQFSVENWFTEIQFGWKEEWFYKNEDIIEKPASGLVPGINGLHAGVVTKLEQDPEGNFRIKVKVPLIDEHEEGTWARVATLDAGNERGSFFLPELQDEVILGFINDDPRQAVVLGMMHSKKNAAPVTASDANNEKGFYTRSKMKLVFDDDKKSITISTPKNKAIIIDDNDGSITLKDEMNNKIVMNSSGISIESASDIQLKATGQIKASGAAKIELTSSGPAVLKGTIVNIN